MEFWKTAVPAILPPVNPYSISAQLAAGVAVARTEVVTEAFQNFLREALENHDISAYAS